MPSCWSLQVPQNDLLNKRLTIWDEPILADGELTKHTACSQEHRFRLLAMLLERRQENTGIARKIFPADSIDSRSRFNKAISS